MAGEVTIAREGSVSSLNGEKNGGRTVPRLYDTSQDARYPASKSLGISTRDETAQKDKAILEGTLGQLSDGIWENSSGMEKYWRSMTFSQDERGDVQLRYDPLIRDRVPKWRRGHLEYDYRYKRSAYGDMNDREVRRFFASKIKAVYNTEKKDYPSTGKWSPDNNNELIYIGNGITVADAYSLYKRLKG